MNAYRWCMLAGVAIAVLARVSSAKEEVLLRWAFEIDKEGNGHIVHCTQGDCPADVNGLLPALKGTDNYADGKLVVRLKVLEKPSSKAVYAQFCAFQSLSSIENCHMLGNFSKQGEEIRRETSSPSSWSGKGKINWSQPLGHLRLFIKDQGSHKLLMTSKCGPACYGGGDIDSHMPMRFDLTIVGLTPGQSFSGWENYEYADETAARAVAGQARSSVGGAAAWRIIPGTQSSVNPARLQDARSVELFDVRGARIARIRNEPSRDLAAALADIICARGVIIINIAR